MKRKRETSPNADDVPSLIAEYRDAADKTSNTNPTLANAQHHRMHACYKRLKETAEGRDGIAALMEDTSPHVRCWAAAHSLAWARDRACRALMQIRDSKGPCSFDAEITLEQYNKGTLSFDY